MAIILFGGSFDPVHNGHLSMIKSALNYLPAARLLMIPAACSPFKTERVMAPEHHRLAMCRLAAETDDRIQVTDREFYMEKPSYTVHTVEALYKEQPEQYFFLCGADAFLSLALWKEYERLISMVTFLAVDRKGAQPGSLCRQQQWLEQAGGKAHLLTMEQVPVSSTVIRKRIRMNQPLTDQVPPPVERYIQENGLYRE